jgi:flagellar biosynthesis GTPase FlhF
MRKFLVISLALHAAVLVLALAVLPSADKFEVKSRTAIEVDISRIGDVSKRMAIAKEAEAPKEKPAPKKSETVKKAEPAPKVDEDVKKAVKEAAAEPRKDEPRKADSKPADPLKDLIKETVTETPAPKKEQPKKTAEKPKEAKKPEKKKREKLDVDKLEAFLNKIDDRAAPEPQSASEDRPAAGEATLQGTDDRLSADIVDALVSRVRGCWTVPPGARDADLSVRIRFRLNPDGSIAGPPEVENWNADPLFDATARSAVAALMECQNYSDLPRDRYELWKDNTLDFNPNLMFDS